MVQNFTLSSTRVPPGPGRGPIAPSGPDCGPIAAPIAPSRPDRGPTQPGPVNCTKLESPSLARYSCKAASYGKPALSYNTWFQHVQNIAVLSKTMFFDPTAIFFSPASSFQFLNTLASVKTGNLPSKRRNFPGVFAATVLGNGVNFTCRKVQVWLHGVAPRDPDGPRLPIAPSGADRAPIAPLNPDRAPIAPSGPDQGAIALSLLALL